MAWHRDPLSIVASGGQAGDRLCHDAALAHTGHSQGPCSLYLAQVLQLSPSKSISSQKNVLLSGPIPEYTQGPWDLQSVYSLSACSGLKRMEWTRPPVFS